MNCLICESTTQNIFEAKVLQKYAVKYYQCTKCKFIQTEKPYWLDEAYESAITFPDVGLVSRNLSFADFTEKLIMNFLNVASKFLDYAGGYGLFVRLMRDKGFDFYRQDPYCENIFARNLDIVNLPDNTRFEMATAFEVFEHWADPLPEFEKILHHADSILFSTKIQPDQQFNSAGDWWYFIPETGQHVAFYTKNSLKIIAAKYNLHFYTNETSLHLFTSKELKQDPFKQVLEKQKKNKTLPRKIFRKLVRIVNTATGNSPVKTPESLLQKDFDDAKERISVNR